jgi:hypothetical protein
MRTVPVLLQLLTMLGRLLPHESLGRSGCEVALSHIAVKIKYAPLSLISAWKCGEGHATAGIVQLTRRLVAYRATGAEVSWPYFLALLAAAYGDVGQPHEGLRVLAEARPEC